MLLLKEIVYLDSLRGTAARTDTLEDAQDESPVCVCGEGEGGGVGGCVCVMA